MEGVIWKDIWQSVSGLNQETPKSIVRDKLLEVKAGLRDGLLQFKQHKKESDEKLTKLLKSSDQEKLLSFVGQLQQFLDLDAIQTWSILCTYLVNEYKGSPQSLSIYIANETNKWKLMNDIWNYYSLERMIVLKLIKNLLEFHREKKHPYCTEYKEVLDGIGLKMLKEKLIEQLQITLKDNHDGTQRASLGGMVGDQHESVKMDLLSSRKLREGNELLQLILLVTYFEGTASPEHLKLFLKLRNNFFLQKLKSQSGANANDLLLQLEHNQIVLILFYINHSGDQLTSWSSVIRQEVDDIILSAHQTRECGPQLLVWMVKNLKQLTADDTVNTRKYHQCGNKAVQLEVFRTLFNVVTSQTFANKPPHLLATVVRRVVYQIMGDLCDLFDADGSVADHSYVFDLFAELLTTPSIANDMIKAYQEEDSCVGCLSLFNTAMELFPAQFVPLSKIAYALSSSGSKSGSDFIKSQLENLPVYTEMCTGREYDLQSVSENDEFLLTKDYHPMTKFHYKIPRGTRVVIIDRKSDTFVHFRHACNYFQILHNDIKMLLAMATISADTSELSLITRITSGVQYLRGMLLKLKSPAEITAEIVHPVELVFDILLKLKSQNSPPLPLLASCMEVCAALLPFFDHEIAKRVLNLNILPSVSNNTIGSEEYARGISFDSGLVGQYLINFETTSGKYVFLKAYFNFLKNYKKVNDPNVYAVELPGLIFLLREIFPCQSWRFDSKEDVHEIYIFAMEYFFEILQTSSTDDAGRKLLRDTCTFSLLNLENGFTLLKFVGIGNPFLQSRMESESNWIRAINSGLNAMVQLSMTILMQILRKNSAKNESRSLSPLETIIYTQPKQRDQLRIIPVVTSYMNNMFNRRLPILSCRLLRRFAIEFQMSLLACLDMEQDHIRMIFLQRLRDDLGSNEMKIAILEFVEACLDKQPGLVEAFFDIRYEEEGSKRKRSKFHIEGIPAYMEEYLEAISNDPEKIASPLLSRIMSLFHAVWRNNMQNLITNLIEGSTFWPSLCKPLFGSLNNRSLRAYSQLFNILGLEVFMQRDLDLKTDLECIVKKFFEPSTFEKWLKFIFGTSDATSAADIDPVDETPEWLCRLQSFKDFLIVILKKKPELIQPRAKSCLLNCLMEQLLAKMRQGEETSIDMRPIVVISELYFFVLLNHGKETETNPESEAEDRVLFGNMSTILSFLANSYDEIIPRIREAILGANIHICLTYPAKVGLTAEIGLSIVQSTVSIICQELNASQIKSSTSLNLALSLLRKLLLINNERMFFDFPTLSTKNKLLYRILSALQSIGQKYENHKVTLELLELLTLIANSSDTNEFLFSDISEYLWLKLLPPKALLAQDPLNGRPSDDGQWTLQNWWPIYSQSIALVTVLLNKHECLFVQSALEFVGIHEEFLMDSMNLVRENLEPNAMQLIKNAVALICECAKYRKTWQLEHPNNMNNLMRCVQLLTEQLISLLYRPNLLKMLLDGRPQNNQLVDLSAPIATTPEIVTAMNQVIEIIILCTKALMYFSPPLASLICAPRFVPTQWQALIEIQFGAPKFNEAPQQLSFGTLLSAVGTFTKALNLMHYSFHEAPLNFEGNESSADRAGTTINMTTGPSSDAANASTTSKSPRTPYSKALSVSSGFGNQTIANCNEILSSLDGSMCVMALEYVLSLLLSQSYLAIKDVHLSVREKQLIKRELSTELTLYNDFIKKRLNVDSVGSLHRKKQGIIPANEGGAHDRFSKQGTATAGTSAQPQQQQQQRRLSQQNSMRVNVVRKLHLQQQKGIPGTSDVSMQGSTPNRNMNPAVGFENITPIKAASTGQELTGKRICYEDDIEYVQIEDAIDVGLSYVNLVEEDYLHFLSILFSIVCHAEN